MRFVCATLAVGALASTLSCTSPLGSRHAGANRDAAALDVAMEVAAADGAGDGTNASTPDASSTTGSGFRIVNNQDYTVYFSLTGGVSCRRVQPPGDEECNFFHDWKAYDCASVPQDGNCCIFPERDIPGVLPIPPGQEHFIPWSGIVYGGTVEGCRQCQCQRPLPEQAGGYVASIWVASSYTCGTTTACQTGADGAITGAQLGGLGSASAAFINPWSSSEVVLLIGSPPPPDAGDTDLGLTDGPTFDR
jgi:hypothetical protein